MKIASFPRASTPGNREETQSLDFLLPESVKDFVFDLHDSMRRAKRVHELEPLYNTEFKKLTDAYFKGSTWPEAEVIQNQCSNDELFLCFYRELRNRHLFATTNVRGSETRAVRRGGEGEEGGVPGGGEGVTTANMLLT